MSHHPVVKKRRFRSHQTRFYFSLPLVILRHPIKVNFIHSYTPGNLSCTKPNLQLNSSTVVEKCKFPCMDSTKLCRKGREGEGSLFLRLFLSHANLLVLKHCCTVYPSTTVYLYRWCFYNYMVTLLCKFTYVNVCILT